MSNNPLSNQSYQQPSNKPNNPHSGQTISPILSDSQVLEECQKLMKHLKMLTDLGHSNDVVQAQWQQYYNRLTNHQKHLVWRYANNRDQHRVKNRQTNINQQADNLMPALQPPISDQQQRHLPHIDHTIHQPTNQEPISNPADLLQIHQPASTPDRGQQVQHEERMNHAHQQFAERYSHSLSSMVESNRYDQWMQAKLPTQENQDKAKLQPMLTPNYYTGMGDVPMDQVMPDTKVRNKLRKLLLWNSKTAVFDKDQRKKIRRQNWKSLTFGLTVGLIVYVTYQFPTLNERYIIPRIQPVVEGSSVPVVTPVDGRSIEDSTFRVIIPKLNVDPPVVDGIVSYRSQDPNEHEDLFEDRMQEALRSGVAHYPTSSLPGESGIDGYRSNVVIIGHSSGNVIDPGKYKFIFAKLNTLAVDDLVLVNYQNKQYVYKIYEKKIVEPGQIEVLGQAKLNNSLTLITCEPPGTVDKRLVLVAEQINPHPQDNRPVVSPSDAGDDIFIIPSNAPGLSDNLWG